MVGTLLGAMAFRFAGKVLKEGYESRQEYVTLGTS
jgi:hypothetical protein